MDLVSIIENVSATTWRELVQFVLIIFLLRQNKILTKKYHSLNELVGKICVTLHIYTGVKLIRQHRTGDYEPINPLFDGDKPKETQ